MTATTERFLLRFQRARLLDDAYVSSGASGRTISLKLAATIVTKDPEIQQAWREIEPLTLDQLDSRLSTFSPL